MLVVAGVACTANKADENNGSISSQAKGSPPGNNGTWKIQEAGAPDEIPDNDPHVGCKFNIEWRGYEQGDLQATWELAAQMPSGNGDVVANGTVDIGEDPAGGAPDLDGFVEIDVSKLDLSGLTLQPQQGYHLKLTVHAEGSIGADTKHKVFWVGPCGGESSSSSGGSSSGGSSSGESPDAGSTSSSGGSSSGGSSSGKTW
jgi:uncharacterized membrane protein YgcG